MVVEAAAGGGGEGGHEGRWRGGGSVAGGVEGAAGGRGGWGGSWRGVAGAEDDRPLRTCTNNNTFEAWIHRGTRARTHTHAYGDRRALS